MAGWVARVSDGVALFMRVEGQREVQVGRAVTMSDVPVLLRELADRWSGGEQVDEPLFPPPDSGSRATPG